MLFNFSNSFLKFIEILDTIFNDFLLLRFTHFKISNKQMKYIHVNKLYKEKAITNLCPLGKFSAMNGTTFSSRISKYMAVVSAPSKIWRGEAPLREIAPHKWRVVCCRGWFGSGGWPLSWFSDAKNGLSDVLPMNTSWSKWSPMCDSHHWIRDWRCVSVSTGFRRMRRYTKPYFLR